MSKTLMLTEHRSTPVREQTVFSGFPALHNFHVPSQVPPTVSNVRESLLACVELVSWQLCRLLGCVHHHTQCTVQHCCCKVDMVDQQGWVIKWPSLAASSHVAAVR